MSQTSSSSTSTTPYGGWKSPLKAELLASASVNFSSLWVDGADLYWIEGRPLEKGRGVVVRYQPATHPGEAPLSDMTRAASLPPDLNVRTTVHEYGGGAYFVHQGRLFFSNFSDQRLYLLADGQLTPLTPPPAFPWGLRYADGRVIPSAPGETEHLVCVRQRHQDDLRADNELVVIPTAGGEAQIIASGCDFYSDPRPSPDGRQLAWLCWNHPNMPWDGSELWLADLTPDGLRNAQRLAGGPDESIYQPQWSPDGRLHFASDRTGWWNLYRWDAASGQAIPLAPLDADFGLPQWVFGICDYAFLPDGSLACLYRQDGRENLGLIAPQGDLRRISLAHPVLSPDGAAASTQEYTLMDSLHWGNGRLWLIAASPLRRPEIIAVALPDLQVEVIRQSTSLALDPGYISIPQALDFPTEGGLRSHAWFYPPQNKDFSAPAGELPPLLVISHGGPTGASSALLSFGIQYWTSRGFAVVDVNYGGSSGYGRAYRQRLNGNWGVVDVQDCINAARDLIAQGLVDPRRVAVRGGSAGGYTTLVGLTQHNFFAAGASHYGLADLETFVNDTHKFESRYLERLIGPYPQAAELYRQRSPVHFADRIACPVILFQGLEDKVVPPAQAETMVAALQARGLPYAYIPFEGEQHGFRKAENIQRAAEAELYFYARVFGFEPAEALPPVEIAHFKS